MTSGFRIIVISNLVTITVTAIVVLLSLHYQQTTAGSSTIHNIPIVSSVLGTNGGSTITGSSRTTTTTARRFLQDLEDNEQCCDCTTGEPIVDSDTTPAPTTVEPGICFLPTTSWVYAIQKDKNNNNGAWSSSHQQPKRILMKDLQLGDSVLTDNGQYETIYSFGHYDITTTTSKKKNPLFIRIVFDHGDDDDGKKKKKNFVDMSPNHMIYSFTKKKYLAAGLLQVGDFIVDGAAKATTSKDAFATSSSSSPVALRTVLEIQTTPSSTIQGAMAPFTSSGTIVVNDIIASTYVDMMYNPNNNNNDWTKMMNALLFYSSFSPQKMAHAFTIPHRLYCSYSNTNQCQSETYTRDGISTWIAQPYKWIVFMLNNTTNNNNNTNNNILATMLSFVFVSMMMMTLGCMSVMEQMMIGSSGGGILWMMMIFVLVVGITMMMMYSRTTAFTTIVMKKKKTMNYYS